MPTPIELYIVNKSDKCDGTPVQWVVRNTKTLDGIGFYQTAEEARHIAEGLNATLATARNEATQDGQRQGAEAMQNSSANLAEMQSALCQMKAGDEPTARVAWNHAADMLNKVSEYIRALPLPEGTPTPPGDTDSLLNECGAVLEAVAAYMAILLQAKAAYFSATEAEPPQLLIQVRELSAKLNARKVGG